MEMEINDLKDTVELMLSPHFKDRLAAELAQLDIRISKLNNYINKIKKRESDENEKYLYFQLAHMCGYRSALVCRMRLLGFNFVHGDDNERDPDQI